VSNYWFIWHGGDGAPAGTVPYWSLAVEEHFYLLFPLLYILLSRYMSRAAQARVVWGLCAAVCVWRCVLVFVGGVSEDRTYMGSDTRFDSIFFGCALALGANPVLDRLPFSETVWKWILLPASLAILIFTFAYRPPWFRETIRYTLQGIALTPVFVAAVSYPRWLPFRVLNARPVALVGVLSYVLYLVHQVALFTLGYQFPLVHGLVRAIMALVGSFCIAALIHYFVEKPCARLRRRLTRTAPAQ
jgi:peptidoglycan/LPS O-acetylase OafA/YrhL